MDYLHPLLDDGRYRPACRVLHSPMWADAVYEILVRTHLAAAARRQRKICTVRPSRSSAPPHRRRPSSTFCPTSPRRSRPSIVTAATRSRKPCPSRQRSRNTRTRPRLRRCSAGCILNSGTTASMSCSAGSPRRSERKKSLRNAARRDFCLLLVGFALALLFLAELLLVGVDAALQTAQLLRKRVGQMNLVEGVGRGRTDALAGDF